jgi:hypothetical protein
MSNYITPVEPSTVVYRGITTAVGNIGGTTILCAALIGSNDFLTGKTVLLKSGTAVNEAHTVSVFNSVNGQITVDTAFTVQIPPGVRFYVIAGAGGGGSGVSDYVPVSNSVVANWNSGVATSGLAGADLVTIGANGANRVIHSMLVSIRALTPAATITVRLYQQINNTEDLVYSQTFVQGTDPSGLWIVNGSVGVHEAVRVEVQSGAAGDDGLAVDYDYLVEA